MLNRARAFDPGDPALPVAGRGVLSRVRPSRRSRVRATVLGAVHLVILLHVAHFLLAGRTLSPVEPSESMYTLELGQVNAGFVFFIAALVSTLIFGRFFCGWGCHLVALQDLCAWMMKRIGIRPRPFRSRLLLLGPLIVALYMFAWPTFKRVVLDDSPSAFPGFSNHLMTSGFWDTFPGPLFALLTLASCGFAAVYLLGAKGFCTYGCPYGALFGVADRFAFGRILVSDACDQCGHCTVTCTSNVRVHQEVRDHGRVIDPGCMKCTDCVSVCPKGALRFGFAWPRLRARTPRPRPPGRLSWPHELLVAAVALVATLAFRGLYDGPPLLMAAGLGAMTAFVALQVVRLIAGERDLRLQSLWLRKSGRFTAAGRAFVVLTTLWLVFTAHSAFVQWHRAEGRRLLDATEVTRAEVFDGSWWTRRPSARHERARSRMADHFAAADRWGLGDTVDVKLGLAWDRLLSADPAGAEGYLDQALALAPDNPALWSDLFELSLIRGRPDPALVAVERIEGLGGRLPAAGHCKLADLLANSDRADLAIGHYLRCLEHSPAELSVRYNLGGLLRRAGRLDEAVVQLEQARALAPNDADTHVELGLAYAATGRDREAIEAFTRAIELAPDRPESRLHLPRLIDELRGRSAARP
ncbi:MAG TPA: tetratricopeptide repeat protein [Candidatus Polarisedimenticolaceae bacterium]|nr:tetratricopeptide repeat protein [Candidatus Polarisedimenticolaceae bacterium]